MSIKPIISALALFVLLTGNTFADSAHKHMMHGMGHKHDVEGSQSGKPASSKHATKTIHVSTLDSMRYEFSPQLHIKSGDIIKFVVSNQGKVAHEFSIGDEKEHKAHQKMMRSMPDMVHEDGNTITVKPGEKKELTWKFNGTDSVVFACNIPGHFEAGMSHKVKIH